MNDKKENIKKILIITLYSNNNFGNKLQNYALQEYIKKVNNNFIVYSLRVKNETNTKNIFKLFVSKIYHWVKNSFRKIDEREKVFIEFNKNINYTDFFISSRSTKRIKNFDYYIYGSDQVWNPNGGGATNLFLGQLSDNNISYAASFSENQIPQSLKEKYRINLNKFNKISVREDRGKEIVEELTERNDIEVLIDPTMLLTHEEWDKVSKKPKMLKKGKYILNYFLGDLSEQRKREIQRIADENDCDIINILDRNSPFYVCGPSEFLWLEKNAFLICTDSFHSSVFSVIFNRPFIIFKREENNAGNMYSRIDTLVSKFKLKNREYNGKNITKENLEHDYTEAYKILEEERKKSDAFLKKALDIEESE